MVIEKTILSRVEPKDTTAAWAKPVGENIQLNIFNNGKWRPINGSGSNTTVTNKYTSDPNAPMLSLNNFFDGAVFETVTKLGFDTNSELTSEQNEQIFNELKSYKFATPKQGNAVLIDYDLDNGIFTFQCDDGSIITFTSDHGDTFITGLRPGIDGYIIWKTTIDKLPVRESQEEPNPGGGSPKSVKSGPSLKTSGGGGTGEVYTVINNNTGEIVDPLELHKLTNVIWYNYYSGGGYFPFYLNGVTDIDKLLPSLQGMDLNELSISTWVCTIYYKALTFSYLNVALYYDYTLKPGSVCNIQTTNNHTITDIDDLFDDFGRY